MQKNQTNICSCYAQWRSKGGGQVGHAPRGAGLGGASAHFFQSFKNAFQAKM